MLWVRIDPELNTLHSSTVKQPEFQWQYQLKYERDVFAQLEALESLKQFPTTAARFCIIETVENERCYYRVRQAACETMAEVANRLASSWSGPPALMATFKKLFSSVSSEDIVKENDFSDFQHYYLQMGMVRAMGMLRSTNGDCVPEIRPFLMDLIRFNYNGRNKYQDDYYRAALIDSLAATVVSNTHVMYSASVEAAQKLKPEGIVNEVATAFNIDKMIPSYKSVISLSCLNALCHMQLAGKLNPDPSLFITYMGPGHFRCLREKAVSCLAKYIKGLRNIISSEQHQMYLLGVLVSLTAAILLPPCHGAKKGGPQKIDISSGIMNPDPKGAEPAMAEYNTDKNMFQGDMVLSEEQKRGGAANRNAASDPNKLWPQGNVPYEVARSVQQDPERMTQIRAAIADYNQYTCVHWVPRKQEEDFVKITSAQKGCFSHLGRNGGQQEVNLGEGCWKKGTVIHEMLHALGFEHEHMRGDRDNYVTILFENIVSDEFKFNFQKMAAGTENNMGLPYDYQSVLHYNQYAFTPDYVKKSIITRDPAYQDKIGQRAGFSQQDIQEVNTLYKCQGKKSGIGGRNGCLDKDLEYCKFRDEEHRIRRCGDRGVRQHCKLSCTKCDQPGYKGDGGSSTCFDENSFYCQETLKLKNGVDEWICQAKADYCKKSCKRC